MCCFSVYEHIFKLDFCTNFWVSSTLSWAGSSLYSASATHERHLGAHAKNATDELVRFDGGTRQAERQLPIAGNIRSLTQVRNRMHRKQGAQIKEQSPHATVGVQSRLCPDTANSSTFSCHDWAATAWFLREGAGHRAPITRGTAITLPGLDSGHVVEWPAHHFHSGLKANDNVLLASNDMMYLSFLDLQRL